MQESNLDIVLRNVLLLEKENKVYVSGRFMCREVMTRNYENKFLAIKCIADIKPN